MPKVKDIYEALDEFAPFSNQCTWDNSGFLIGNASKDVRRVAFALDLTSQTIDKAIEFGAELIVTHHPAIFHAKKRLTSDDPVYKAIASGFAVISSHTCFDCADGGVNDVLGELLDLGKGEPIPSEEMTFPMARLCVLEKEMSPVDFSRYVAEKLSTTVRLGDAGRPVRKVAVCGGSAMDLIDEIVAFGADTFLTGDAKHHEILDAIEMGINVVAAGHFETEKPSVSTLKNVVSRKWPELETIEIDEKNPISFIG